MTEQEMRFFDKGVEVGRKEGRKEIIEKFKELFGINDCLDDEDY